MLVLTHAQQQHNPDPQQAGICPIPRAWMLLVNMGIQRGGAGECDQADKLHVAFFDKASAAVASPRPGRDFCP